MSVSVRVRVSECMCVSLHSPYLTMFYDASVIAQSILKRDEWGARKKESQFKCSFTMNGLFVWGRRERKRKRKVKLVSRAVSNHAGEVSNEIKKIRESISKCIPLSGKITFRQLTWVDFVRSTVKCCECFFSAEEKERISCCGLVECKHANTGRAVKDPTIYVCKITWMNSFRKERRIDTLALLYLAEHLKHNKNQSASWVN